MKSFRCRTSHGRGFTLVEVLVVIVIIGVLGALTVGLSKATMQRSKETRCVANLRQLGIAAMMYSSENQGQMVPHAIFDREINENREWCYGYGQADPDNAFKEGILGPYLSDAQDTLNDPTFSYEGDPMESTGDALNRTRPTSFGFGYNGFFLSQKMTTYGQWQGYHLSTIERPGQTIMFATSAEYGSGKVRPYENIWPRQRLSQRVIRAVDGKGAYVCYVSGQVTKLPLVRTVDYQGTVLGHVEGPNGENLFDRFDGDKGDRN